MQNEKWLDIGLNASFMLGIIRKGVVLNNSFFNIGLTYFFVLYTFRIILLHWKAQIQSQSLNGEKKALFHIYPKKKILNLIIYGASKN